jgi:hypothetical protein
LPTVTRPCYALTDTLRREPDWPHANDRDEDTVINNEHKGNDHEEIERQDTNCYSVLGRMLDVIDDEDINRTLGRFQSEPELLL